MSVINKPSDINKIWAEGGDKVSPSDVKIGTGWEVEVPPRQWFNWLDSKQDQAIAHINQFGIPVWDSVTEYQADKSYVQGSDGIIYLATQTATNQNPVSSPAYWRKLLSFNGTVGQTINAAMSISTASASATFTAESINVSTSIGGVTYTLASVNKVVNLATIGAGGMDIGTAPANGYVALYVIYNPATQVSNLLAKNATAAKQSEVYNGANMPSGYTASALVAVLPTNASSLFNPVYLLGRKVIFSAVSALSTTAGGTNVSLYIAGVVPKNAKTISGIINAAATAGNGGVTMSISSTSTGVASQILSGYTVSPYGINTPITDLLLLTEQNIWYSMSLSGPSTGLFNINISSYTF